MALKRPSWETNTDTNRIQTSVKKPSWETNPSPQYQQPVLSPPQPPQQGGIFNTQMAPPEPYELPRDRVTRQAGEALNRGEYNRGDVFLSNMMSGLTLGAGQEKLAQEMPKYSQGILSTATAGQLAGSILPFGKAYQAASKLPFISKIASPVLKSAVTGLVGDAPLGAVKGGVEAFAEGKRGTDVLKQAGTEAALYGGGAAIFGPLAEVGLPALANKIKPAFDKVFKRVGSADPEMLVKGVAKEIGVDWDNMNDTQKAAIRKVVRDSQSEAVQSGRLLNEGQNFEMIGKPYDPAKPPILPKKQAQAQVTPLEFKQTIEQPKVYDKDAFIGETKTRSQIVDEIRAMKGKPPKVPSWEEPIKQTAQKLDEPLNPTKLKDLSGWRAYTNSVYRNFEAVFGEHFPKVKKEILDPFDASKKANVETQELWANKLKTEVVDRLGIQKGSRLSKMVQKYGEKTITEQELLSLRTDELAKVKEADTWFRKAYKTLLDEVNEIRAKIYPYVERDLAALDDNIKNIRQDIQSKQKELEIAQKATTGRGAKAQQLTEQIDHLKDRLNKAVELKNNEDLWRGKRIPERQDYYRHFRELSDTFEGVKNLFETPAGINPSLAGISDFTQPKSKFLSFAQKRGLGPFKNDAVGGFLDYIPAASYAKHIDPHISKFTKLADELATATEGTKNLNTFIEYLRDYSGQLAGKTNPFDRAIQKIIPGGRMAFKGLNWLNSRVKANVIMGNAASSLSQIANVPQGIAYNKQYSIPGFTRYVRSIFKPSAEMAQSGFLKERFSHPFRQFDQRLIDQPKKFAAWMLEVMDKVGTEYIWNSTYQKALAEKIANPVKYADDITRNLVAGRGIGEVSIAQQAKLVQLVAPFTVEVANLWHVQRDFLKARDFTGLAMLYAANFLLNRGLEQVRGSGIVFDPIDAVYDALSEEDISPTQRAGRLAGEVISNTPAGQFVAAAYPEHGFGKDSKMPYTRKELFGRNDPTRFGTGLLIGKGLSDPLYKALPPFGGAQAQKTIRGIRALSQGGVYNTAGTQLKYPVDTGMANTVKGALFGPGGFPETREYYESNRRPLSEKQTKAYQRSPNPQAMYRETLKRREIDRINAQIKKLNTDTKMTPEEKHQRYLQLDRKRALIWAEKK
jgi:hypothetical protein